MRKLNAGRYTRKSREDDKSPSFRLDAQKRILSEHCKAQGWNCIEYDEDIASASKGNIQNLEARKRLEADIRAGKIDIVLVIDLSRLSRDESMEDYVFWLALCAENNVCIATPTRKLNPSETSDWMLLLIEGGFSSTEMKILKIRMEQGRREAFMKGSFLGGTPPAPYIYHAESRQPVIEQTALSLYQKIWRLAETFSAKSISEQLGLPYSSVRRALADDRLDFYQAQRRDLQTSEMITCQWPAVMTPDQAARIRAARRTRTSNGQSTKPTSLLSGLNLLKCGYCGQTVKTWFNGRPRKDGTKLRYYGCSSKDTSNKCPKSRTVPQIVLDTRLLTNVFNTIGCLEDLMRHWLASQGRDDYDSQRKKLEIEERSLQQQMDRLIESVTKDVFSLDQAAKIKSKLTTALAAIKAEKHSLKSTQISPPDWDSLLLTREEFDHLDFTDRRRFLSLLLDEVRVYQTYAILNFKFPRDKNGDRTARIHLPEPRRGTAWHRQPLYKIE
jgi:site-specific DNA recombinase